MLVFFTDLNLKSTVAQTLLLSRRKVHTHLLQTESHVLIVSGSFHGPLLFAVMFSHTQDKSLTNVLFVLFFLLQSPTVIDIC